MTRLGRSRSEYKDLNKDGDLAELIGVILGDGHLQKFPRTERLLIFSNSNNPGFISRYSILVEKVIGKKPYVYQQTGKQCTRISVYEKYLSERLDVPTGARKELVFQCPEWILTNREHIVRYLRGLYEAEGCESHHQDTYTHKLVFWNLNQSLLMIVFRLWCNLGFHPHRDNARVQLSRKDEVKAAVELLQFRKYTCGIV